MNKFRAFSLDISINWMMIGASLIYGTALGYAVGKARTKVLSFLLIPTLILIFRTVSDRIKFWLLALSIPLSLVQIPSLPLPYGTSISEAILVILLLDDVLFVRVDHTSGKKLLTSIIVIFLALFALAGLIANLRGGDFYSWNAYCLMPLIIFLLISRKIHSQEDAWLLVKLSSLTIVGFLLIVEWATLTGHYMIYDPLHTETAASGESSRMADGMIIILGPIRFTTFATRIGAIAALGLPSSVLLWMENKGKAWWRTGLFLIIAGLGYVLILSATRGSVVAAIIGSLMVILISGRFRSPIFVGASALSLITLTLWGEAILDLLPSGNIQRLLTLLQGVQSIHNYHQRVNVLSLAWNITLDNPLGVGFGYLYHRYQIDDAIIYAIILQATGILGAIAFIMIVGYLTFWFGLGALKSHIGSARDLASVGLSTLATGLIAGVSSQSTLFEPVHSYVFWMLMAVCYCTIIRLPSRFAS